MLDMARRCTAIPVRPDPAKRRQLQSVWLLTAVLLAALLGACGYHQDVPHLPGGAHTLTLRRITNLTDTGELDVRLRTALQQRLAQQAHIRLQPPERSALALSIELSSFTLNRVLDPAITTERSFVYTLTGRVTLTDLRNGRTYIAGEALTASVTRLYAPDVQETPAIRDEGLNDAVAAFAEQVQQRIQRTF